MRRCAKCGETKPLDAFGVVTYRERPKVLAYCKPCHITYHREWRSTPRGRSLHNAGIAASRARHPQHERARRVLRQALKMERINRGTCCIGGDCEGVIEAHHDDYTKPLEVRWVCRKHHRILDRERTYRTSGLFARPLTGGAA